MDYSIEVEKIMLQFPDIELVILFGSIAHHEEENDSDVDIAVAGSKRLTVHQKIELQVALAKQLPREVDLIDLQNVSGVILQQILSSGVIVKPSFKIYAGLISRMWFNQADMMPLTKRILQRHCQRFIYG